MRIERHQLQMAAVIAGSIALYAGVVWWPQKHHIAELQEQIAEAEDQLGVARGQTDALARLARDVDQLRRQVTQNHKTIPARADMGELIRQLSLQIDRAQLAGQNITTEPAEPADDAMALPVVLTFEGSGAAVFDLVDRIENMPRLMQVQSLRLHSEDPAAGRVRGALHLRTYFQPPNEGGA